MGKAIKLVENFKVEKVILNCGEFNELKEELIEIYRTIKDENIMFKIIN